MSIIGTILTAAVVLAAGVPVDATPGDEGFLRGLVESLTAPELAGRGAGSPGAHAAADTLARRLSDAGLVPAFAGRWTSGFALEGEDWHGVDLAGRSGVNVAGIVPGSGDLADRWLVVGAHLDHLGREPGGPDAAWYPGANDNASGVAIVQWLARRAAASSAGPDRRSLLFIHFGGEEVGLQGSRALVNDPPVPLDAVDLMLNLDTVGRLLDGQLYLSGLGTAAGLDTLVAGVPAEGFALSTARGGWSGSDHMVFNTREVPVLFFFGGPYPEYNRPDDTADGLDYRSMLAVARYAEGLLSLLAIHPEPLAWEMVGDGGLRDGDGAAEEEGANRRTWLGTMPDFSEETTGYRLAGVFDGSPAAAAGLEKGDVLTVLGGRPVEDLATFTRALRAHDPGAVVEIELLRDGRPLRYTVVLGDRADRR